MSKELEALNKIWRDAYPKACETWSADRLLEHWRVLEKALTPPTAEEVCKALSEIEGIGVRYEENSQAFINEHEQTLIVMMDSGLLLRLYETYPASVITLIGRFYKGVEHERN